MQAKSIADLLAASTNHFWSKVKRGKPDDCWPWAGGGTSKTKKYGRHRWLSGREPGNHISPHRLAWILTNDVIPEGMNVLHQCDNPSCCNPAHLFIGSQSDNMIDCTAKGRRPHRGPPHENCRLARLKVTPELRTAIELALEREPSLTRGEISKRFNLSFSTLHRHHLGNRQPGEYKQWRQNI